MVWVAVGVGATSPLGVCGAPDGLKPGVFGTATSPPPLFFVGDLIPGLSGEGVDESFDAASSATTSSLRLLLVAVLLAADEGAVLVSKCPWEDDTPPPDDDMPLQ